MADDRRKRRGGRNWRVGIGVLAVLLVGSAGAQGPKPESPKVPLGDPAGGKPFGSVPPLDPASPPGQASGTRGKPRLILLLVVDQARAEYLERFAPQFGPGGFERLKREGAYFLNCHFPYAKTETAPGHATISTGATPNRHGIVANVWFDHARGRAVGAVQDERHKTVTDDKPVPAERQAGSSSPHNLMTTSIGDELKVATDGRSKLFGIGWKDRAAILTAGKAADGAFWAADLELARAGMGGFVSSTYYMNQLPKWLGEFNRTEVEAYVGRKWTKGDPSTSLPSTPLGASGTGKVFVELTKPANRPELYYATLPNTPFANELLVKLAERLMVEERLGADEVPDVLAVVFSANDYVGHRFGPYSEQVEDITLQTDALIARLFKFVDERVGAGNYWVVVSGDHGVAPTLEQARARGIRAKNLMTPQLYQTIFKALEARWGNDEWLLAGGEGVVFNREALVRRGVSLAEAAQVVGEAAMTVDGIMGWIASPEVRASGAGMTGLPAGYAEAFGLSEYPGRVADVDFLLEPYTLVNGERGTTGHGTPHSYDTHVPLILWGAPFRAGVYYDRVTPVDIAPTLAAALGIIPPSGANGRVLSEALREVPVGPQAPLAKKQ